MHHARRGSKYLQQYQIDYIRDNAATLTSKQMAGAIGCSQMKVIWHCNKMKIKPTKQCFQFKPPVIPPCINLKAA
jgi:hypothetical protein